MNLCELARKLYDTPDGLKKSVRRKSSPRIVGSSGEGWVEFGYFLHQMKPRIDDFLVDDWEIFSE